MTRLDCKVGMKVSYQGEMIHVGTITKLKPIVAVLEVFNPVDEDNEIHEISYHRLRKLND